MRSVANIYLGNHLIKPPAEARVSKRYLVKVHSCVNRKVSDEFLSAALLPGIGNALDLIFLLLPSEDPRENLSALKPGKNIDFFIE